MTQLLDVIIHDTNTAAGDGDKKLWGATKYPEHNRIGEGWRESFLFLLSSFTLLKFTLPSLALFHFRLRI